MNFARWYCSVLSFFLFFFSLRFRVFSILLFSFIDDQILYMLICSVYATVVFLRSNTLLLDPSIYVLGNVWQNRMLSFLLLFGSMHLYDILLWIYEYAFPIESMRIEWTSDKEREQNRTWSNWMIIKWMRCRIETAANGKTEQQQHRL